MRRRSRHHSLLKLGQKQLQQRPIARRKINLIKTTRPQTRDAVPKVRERRLEIRRVGAEADGLEEEYGRRYDAQVDADGAEAQRTCREEALGRLEDLEGAVDDFSYEGVFRLADG